ncbi:MAG: hypothetical protein IAE99_00820 [Rhodothermales bacterium]|nr:hypothetical protein [Rhodothermales bacterium]
MDVSLYTARTQADVLKLRDDVEAAYDAYPDATLFWGFVDLSGSSNYRIAHGPKEGYLRGETFFALVRSVVAASTDVRLIKEIGDEVLLTSNSFRPLFESLILITETARQLAYVAGTQTYPFAVRSAIGFGPAKRLMRTHEDFIGTPIDQLARVMSIRSERSNLLIHEEAFSPSRDIITEYADFAEVGEPIMITASISKDMSRPVYYREVIIELSQLPRFKKHFEPWRRSHAA